MIAFIGLYISAYVAFRALGFYQWKQMSITRQYHASDKRFIEVYNYDLISAAAPWRGLVYSVKPVFIPLSNLECALFIKKRHHQTAPGLAEPRS